MFEVTVENYDELASEEKFSVSDNGSGRKYANYLRIRHNGETILLENDACEPEDSSFVRHFGFVKEELEKAYELGKKDGYNECLDKKPTFMT